MVTRRQWLSTSAALATVGLTGCVGGEGDDGDGVNLQRNEIAVTDVENIEEHGFDFDVNVKNATLDGDDPAKVYLALENVSDEPVDAWEMGSAFTQLWDTEETLAFIQYDWYEDGNVGEQPEDCWIEEGGARLMGPGNPSVRESEIPPGEYFYEDYAVFGDKLHLEEACPEPGEYVVEMYYPLNTWEEPPPDYDFSWEITFKIG